eukprot:CAMPEP_0114535310 /NCGR_PEP_ID=MMETSP0109-20121206/28355_1 /TAXON_ID=29199 /ORGANISM="Chlorarachnion reptans, Strain CCCM449" /LENGTH=408 /DNA_ID=CAMNT_0001718881 /DNA_START=782 /DNA_END=2008 /DNA_ORIENTATION=-
MVNHYRSLQLEELAKRHPIASKKWTRILEVSDKCPGQYFSKSAARACAEWIQEAPTNLNTLLKFFKVTAHGAFRGDGEGGEDKRSVTRFIQDECSWHTKLGLDTKDRPKPVVNCARVAAEVAKAMRGRTEYQRKMDAHLTRGTKKPENEGGVVNERIHLHCSDELDHSKDRFGCKPIRGIKGWYCWRFEKKEPAVMYKRKRACVCDSCINMKWESCSLKNMIGGPGEWVKVNLEYIDPRGVALERKRRETEAKVFKGKIKKGTFVALQLEEEFLGMAYGIAKAQRKVYKATRNIAGNIQKDQDVLDVSWWAKTAVESLVFQDSGEVQTVAASRIASVKITWGRHRRPNRRSSRRDLGTKTLSLACHERINEHIQTMQSPTGADPSNAATVDDDDEEGEVVGYDSDEDA